MSIAVALISTSASAVIFNLPSTSDLIKIAASLKLTIPSLAMYTSDHPNEEVPNAISLSVTGLKTPSANVNCCAAVLDTST